MLGKEVGNGNCTALAVDSGSDNGKGRGHKDVVLPCPGNTVFPVSQLEAYVR